MVEKIYALETTKGNYSHAFYVHDEALSEMRKIITTYNSNNDNY